MLTLARMVALPTWPGLGEAVLVAAVLMGLLLWLLGRRLARLACSVCGLVLGGLAGYAVALQAGHQTWVLAYLIGGALAGVLIAAMVFRLWMGASMALLLALLAPAGGMFWQGAGAPAGVTSAAAGSARAVEAPPPAPNAARPAPTPADLWRPYQHLFEDEAHAATAWWKHLSPPGRKAVLIAAGIAALVGLLVGLLRPSLAAALQSALVGTLLMYAGAKGLLALHAPAQAAWLSSGPRASLAVLGLITLAGTIVQCMIWRKRADKKPV